MAFDYWGMSIPETLEERLDPRTTGLVVVDMQNDFLHAEGHCATAVDVAGFREPIAPLRGLIAAARSSQVPIFYVMMTQRPDGLYASPVWIADGLRYPGLEPIQCMDGTWGQQVIDELAPAPGDVVVKKYRRSGFRSTNLATMLRNRGLTSIVATGIAATGCLESTVRDALEEDFFVVVPRDCIGDAIPEFTQLAYTVLERLLLAGDLTTSDVVADVWAKAMAAA